MMDEDTDFEEDDILDNPQLKNISLNSDNIKDEPSDDDDNYEEYSNEYCDDDEEMDVESYINDHEDTSEDSLSMESDPKLIPGKLNYPQVVLEDWGPHLERNGCFCNECETLFATRNALDAHNMSAHSFLAAMDSQKEESPKQPSPSRSNKYCSHCNKYFDDGNQLIEHFYDLLTANKNMEARAASVTIGTKTPEQISQPVRQKMYRCIYCCVYSDYKNNLRRHYSNCHKTNVTPTETFQFDPKCKFCEKVFTEPLAYDRHIKVSHRDLHYMVPREKSNESNLIFGCPHCPSKFKTKHQIQIHISMVHKHQKYLNLKYRRINAPVGKKVTEDLPKDTFRLYQCQNCMCCLEFNPSLHVCTPEKLKKKCPKCQYIFGSKSFGKHCQKHLRWKNFTRANIVMVPYYPVLSKAATKKLKPSIKAIHAPVTSKVTEGLPKANSLVKSKELQNVTVKTSFKINLANSKGNYKYRLYQCIKCMCCLEFNPSLHVCTPDESKRKCPQCQYIFNLRSIAKHFQKHLTLKNFTRANIAILPCDPVPLKPSQSSSHNPVPSKPAKSSSHNPVPFKPAEISSHNPVPSKLAKSSSHDPVPSKPAKSSSHNPVPSKPANSSSHNPVPFKSVQSSSHNPVPSKPAKSSSHDPVSSKPAKSSSHNPVPSKPAKSSSHNPAPSTPANSSSHNPVPFKPAQSSSHNPVPYKPAQSSSHDPVPPKPAKSSLHDLGEVPSTDNGHIYKCSCGIHFPTKESIMKHCTNCSPDQEISCKKCVKCGLLFPTNLLVNHTVNHHSDENKKFVVHNVPTLFKCVKCKCFFLNRQSLSNHHLMCDGAIEGENCFYCKLLFHKTVLAEHMESHLPLQSKQETKIYPNEILIYKCQKCKIHFVNKGSSLNHSIKLDHIDPDVGCKVCGLRFSKRDITSHSYLHHTMKNCTLEDFQFVTSAFTEYTSKNIDDLEIVRVGNIPLFKCTRCDLHYCSKGTFQKHIYRDHTIVHTQVECPDCLRKFTKGSFALHQKMKTCVPDRLKAGESVASEPQIIAVTSLKVIEQNTVPSPINSSYDFKLYKCEQCNVYFMGQQSCYRHTVNHIPIRPMGYISCKLCKLQFRINSLTAHVKKHHSDKEAERVLVERYSCNGLSDVKVDTYIHTIDKVQTNIVSTTTDDHDETPDTVNNEANDISTTPLSTEPAVDTATSKDAVPSVMDTESTANVTVESSSREPENLDDSIEIKCEEEDIKYKCSFCDETFNNNTSKEFHESLDHIDGLKDCTICGASFNESILDELHLDIKNDTFTCCICKETLSVAMLSEHSEKHIDVVSYS